MERIMEWAGEAEPMIAHDTLNLVLMTLFLIAGAIVIAGVIANAVDCGEGDRDGPGEG